MLRVGECVFDTAFPLSHPIIFLQLSHTWHRASTLKVTCRLVSLLLYFKAFQVGIALVGGEFVEGHADEGL